MTSDLAIFAGRLREFISIAADEFSPRTQEIEPALRAHQDAEFNGLAILLFALQFRCNPAYRKFCEARKAMPDTVAHWSEIPALPTTAFKELELTCLPPAERTAVFHSSGTTEQRPSRHFHSAESLAVYEASLWPWFVAHIWADSQSSIANSQSNVSADAEKSLGIEGLGLVILTTPPAQAPHSSLVHMFETIRRKLNPPAAAFCQSERRSPTRQLPLAANVAGPETGADAGNAGQRQPADSEIGAPISSGFLGRVADDGSWTLDFDAALTALRDAVARRQPVILLGTAFSFVHLADHLAEQGLRFRLPPGSRVMETGGYKGRSRSLPRAELHSLITERLGIPADHIVCEYGMSELSSQAYDNQVSGGGEHSTFKIQDSTSKEWGEGTQLASASDPVSRNTQHVTRNTPSMRDTANHASRLTPHVSRVFLFPPWARAQVVSPETGRQVADGETGLLRVFDLANVYSVMAIQTEDLAVRRGDGFELFGRATRAEPRGCSLLAAGGES